MYTVNRRIKLDRIAEKVREIGKYLDSNRKKYDERTNKVLEKYLKTTKKVPRKFPKCTGIVRRKNWKNIGIVLGKYLGPTR